MRHRRKTQNLSRFSSYFKATMRSLTQAMIERERIITTKVRARLAQPWVDRLITLGKQTDSIAARRRAFEVLGNHDLVHRLFSDIAPMFSEHQGGYTRVIPFKRRRGDNAELVILELSVRKNVERTRPLAEEETAPVSKPEKPKTEKPKPKVPAASEPAPKPGKVGLHIGKIFKKTKGS